MNYYVTGDAFAFSKIMEAHWYKKLTPPWVGIHDLWQRSSFANFTEGFHELVFVALGFVATVWCWVRLRPSYAVWMTFNWLLITSTAFVVSVPRYTLTFFPIFILFAQLAVKRPLVGIASHGSVDCSCSRSLSGGLRLGCGRFDMGKSPTLNFHHPTFKGGGTTC